jgi:hypothetical protein
MASCAVYKSYNSSFPSGDAKFPDTMNTFRPVLIRLKNDFRADTELKISYLLIMASFPDQVLISRS